MRRLSFLHLFAMMLIVILSLVGCEAQRNASADLTAPIPEIREPADADFQPLAQPDSTTIRIEPPKQQREVGQTATTEVVISNVTNLVGADVELRFDPALLQVQDADPNKEVQILPGDFLDANFVITNEANNEAGVVRYVVTQLDPTPPASGAGTLALITFITTADGTSDLTFSIAKLANSDAQAIPTTTEPGQIIAGQGGEATPTPFPTPTGPPPPPTPTPTEGVPPSPTSTPLPPPTPTLQPTPTPTNIVISPPEPPIPPKAKLLHGATLGFCYRVQLYETIYTIAQKFATTPKAINIANDLAPAYSVFAEQTLFIPETPGRGPNVYIANSDDTLESIGVECRLPASMIARYNYLEEGAQIEEGQPLIIPIPPFPPPSRFKYPFGPLPLVPLPDPNCCGWQTWPQPHR